MNIYSKIIEVQQKNQFSVLCTIVKTIGSVPQKAGAKMLVFEDGSIYGTIGGGTLEYQVIRKAVELIHQNENFLCLLFEKENEKASVEVFFEKIFPTANLFIFGGGHVGLALANFSQQFDFSITVIDPRQQETIASSNKIRYLQKDYLEAIDELEFNQNTFIVIATPNHTTDRDILIKIIHKPHAYVGLIGSRKKVEEIRNYCIEHQLLNNEQLSQIDMPIGIKIAAITPNEIAISILAKLIDVKNKQSKSYEG
ncbi:MAG: XdhC/CoxI family protein [Bacteroidales bacterium]|nr:XdhC/CoxI family protein [Bacteroidales bacterium]